VGPLSGLRPGLYEAALSPLRELNDFSVSCKGWAVFNITLVTGNAKKTGGKRTPHGLHGRVNCFTPSVRSVGNSEQPVVFVVTYSSR
jgi:hypothetical protein